MNISLLSKLMTKMFLMSLYTNHAKLIWKIEIELLKNRMILSLKKDELQKLIYEINRKIKKSKSDVSILNFFENIKISMI